MTISSSPPSRFTLGDFDFALPPELIAQHPAAERSGSRLLDGTAAEPRDRCFRDLPELLREGDLLVVNDTRVVKARLLGAKASGGAVEALVERIEPENRVLAQLRVSKSPKPGARLRFGVGGASSGGAGTRRRRRLAVRAALSRGSPGPARAPGHVPLPPYIARDDGVDDERRCQTVFAAEPGAVAAPTAALHFDAELLAKIAARGVERCAITLHVGAGTFQPVRSDDLGAHVMHSERYSVGADAVAAIARARARGGRVVAVGTTSLRALESAALAASSAGDATLAPTGGETRLFITPGFEFRVVDLLLTNFHLPKSTLLMLVSAFAGHDRVLALYRHAIAERYRFFSYGDAMLLARAGA
jgi:S-adenosylmethionine:tRNA ribosyltransferase-isomerase